MNVKPYASDLIRSMRNRLQEAAHGGLVLRSEDAIAWERNLNTVLSLVEELEEENVLLERRVGGVSRQRGEEEIENLLRFRPRLRIISSVDSGPNGGGSAA